MNPYTKTEKADVLKMARREMNLCRSYYRRAKATAADANRGLITFGANLGDILNNCKYRKKQLIAQMRRVTDLVKTNVKTVYSMK